MMSQYNQPNQVNPGSDLHLQNRMILYATHITPRLEYMAEWLGLYLYKEPLKIVTNKDHLLQGELVFNYSDEQLLVDSIWIKPHALLFESNIHAQQIIIKRRNDLPYFFETDGDFYFDILAASFYLIQRYEEYLPYKKDIYGRYAHENSLAFKENFLHLPLVDLWLVELKKIIRAKFIGAYSTFAIHHFHFLPTYDIDIAYSYKGKGFWRNVGRFMKSLHNCSLAKQQIQVLFGKQQDPFDIYDEIYMLHKKYKLKSIYFFLLAKQQRGYDKNIHPSKDEMRSLVNVIAQRDQTGIHPSWQSGDDEYLLKEEIEWMKMMKEENVFVSRQHYIRMSMPHTFQLLIQHGITHEYSMGYGSINGFRASTCTPYLWYDLQKETSTKLYIFPFCYMEANSIFEQKDSIEQALEELKHYHDITKQLDGTLITIFHNHLIGLNTEGRKWMGFYKDFLDYQADVANM